MLLTSKTGVAMPTEYGRWIVESSLDEGGQAHVFLVHDETEKSGYLYVLKRLKNLDRIDRFVAEIEAVQSIDNPHVVSLVDFDAQADKPYLVMPYFERGTLADLPLDQLEMMERMVLFRGILEGVSCAHSIGVVHRDLKPENVFVADDGSAVVGDFGICHLVDGTRFTATDEAVGPFRYMAPELEDGRIDQVAPATDVYSLGKLLYWLFTGRSFAREKHREPGNDLTRDEVDPFLHFVYALLDRMIVADPASRFPDAGAVLDAFDTVTRKISMNAHAIGSDIPQFCSYCGDGTYRVVVDCGMNRGSATSLHNFGFHFVGEADWVIRVCSSCGHVQVFRADFVRGESPWNTG